MELVVRKIKEDPSFVLHGDAKKGKIFAGSSLVNWVAKNMHLEHADAEEYANSLLVAELIERAPSSKSKSKSFKPTKEYRFVERPTVVVLGGGFGGVSVARALEKDKRVDVVLVDQKPFFESTPEVLRTFVEVEIDSTLKHMQRITVPHRDSLQRGRFVEGNIIEATKDKIVVDSETLNYDYLVIATGSNYRSNIKQSYVTKKDRMNGRTTLMGDVALKIKRAEHIVIAGGGVVGVELAAEIISKYPTKNLTIVHRQPRLCEKLEEPASNYFRKYFTARGVDIILGEEVVEPEEEGNLDGVMHQYTTMPSGKPFKSDLVFWCTGTTPNTGFLKKHFGDFLTPNGLVKTNEFFQLGSEGRWSRIFAVGDCTAWREIKMAERALVHSSIVADNILALVRGSSLKNPYSPPSKPHIMVISLGAKDGVVCSENKVRFTGTIAGKIKDFYFQHLVNVMQPNKRLSSRPSYYGNLKPNKNLPKVLVIGSQTAVGKEVVTSLWSQTFALRADMRANRGPDPIYERHNIEQIEADYEKPFSLGLLLKQVDSMVLFADAKSESRFSEARALLQAVRDRENNIKNIILCFPNSQITPKGDTELDTLNLELEYTLKSLAKDKNIHYTIVRHASLFDDLAVDQGSEIATRKVVTLPKGSEYWLSTYDLSECIAAILFNPKRYRDKTFSLYGPERLPAKKLPQLLGTALHVELAFDPLSRNNLDGLATHFRVHGYHPVAATRLAEYYRARHSPKETGGKAFEDEANKDIETILGKDKKRVSLEVWVRLNAHLFLA